MFGAQASAALGSIVHTIQVALTPVFLLAGIAALLNIFSTRLASVSSQVDALAKAIEDADAVAAELLSRRLRQLYRRSLALDAAVALGAAAGALTCATVLALFVGEAGGFAIAAMLFISFGLAIFCALAAIAAFTVEMLIASKHIRAEVLAGRQKAEPE
jgi:hypothetical protein